MTFFNFFHKPNNGRDKQIMDLFEIYLNGKLFNSSEENCENITIFEVNKCKEKSKFFKGRCTLCQTSSSDESC